MRLYHFTAARFITGIVKSGLSRGMLPRTVRREECGGYLVGVQPGWQWLTVNPDFGSQEWQDAGSLPYRRNDFRIAIDFPAFAESRVVNWLAYSAKHPDPLHESLNAYGNPEDWFVYHGTIDPAWFAGVEMNPIIAGGHFYFGRRPPAGGGPRGRLT